jgi:hypothetical protein
MMPQNHFAVAAVVTLVAVVLFYPDLDLQDTLVWILVAGIVAALIDMDVIIIVRVKAKDDPDLEPWADPREATKDLTGFLVLLQKKGILRTVKFTHMGIAVGATIMGYFMVPDLFLPIVLGVWSHIATDVPYLWRISQAARAEA